MMAESEQTKAQQRQQQLEEYLREITSWVGRGTFQQFITEVHTRIAGHGYRMTRKGNTLTFHKGGLGRRFLALFGVRKARQPLLRVIREGDNVTIPEESVDAEFVHFLATSLEKH
jgi:hypothetical protein